MDTRRKLNYSFTIIATLIIIPIGISFFAYYKINHNINSIKNINILSDLFFKENYLVNSYSHYLIDTKTNKDAKDQKLVGIEKDFLNNHNKLIQKIEYFKTDFSKSEERETLVVISHDLDFFKEGFLKIKDIYVDKKTNLEKDNLLLSDIVEKSNFIESEIFSSKSQPFISSTTDYYKLSSDFEKIKNFQNEFIYKKTDKPSLDNLVFLTADFESKIKNIKYFSDNSRLFLAFNIYREKLKVLFENKNNNKIADSIDDNLLKMDEKVSILLEENNKSPLFILRNNGINKIKNIVIWSISLIFVFLLSLFLFFFFFYKKINKNFLSPLFDILDFSSKVGDGIEREPLKKKGIKELFILQENLNNLDSKMKKNNEKLLKKVDELKVKGNIESLVESLADGIIMYNKKKEIVLKNSAVDKILNVSNNIISLKNIYSIFAKHNLEFHIDLSLRTKEVYRIDNVDLFSKLYEVIITQVSDNDGNSIGGLMVFHKKEIVKSTKHEDDDKVDFGPVISPHFGTPLSYIKLFTEMLSSGKIGSLNKEQKECILNIHQSAINMKELVDKLQDVAILNNNELKIRAEELDITSFIRELIEKYKKKNNINKISINFKELLPSDIKINIDKEIFSKVFFNILNNAIIYSEGKSEIIDIELKELGFNYLLSIKDYGIGIVEEEQDFVFDKFFRAKNAMMKNTEGSGISLYIAKKLLTKVGVELFFESKVGEGTTFFIEIPKGGMRK